MNFLRFLATVFVALGSAGLRPAVVKGFCFAGFFFGGFFLGAFLLGAIVFGLDLAILFSMTAFDLAMNSALVAITPDFETKVFGFFFCFFIYLSIYKFSTVSNMFDPLESGVISSIVVAALCTAQVVFRFSSVIISFSVFFLALKL